MSSSLDFIYQRIATPLEAGAAGCAPHAKSDTARHISPVIAHELNNILTVIQGYADRLRLKHGENPSTETHLKLISEAARRASTLVRNSVSLQVDAPPHPPPDSPPPVPAA